MSLEDYLYVRMISEPLCLFDCDVPADGSTAIIVSAAEAAADHSRSPVRIESIGTALRGRPSWDQFDDLTTMALRDAAAMMWERTDLSAADVDVAELYDGFSFITLAWLEALGFCEQGQGGAFIEDGRAIAREACGTDGGVALNTHGGQLSAGRLHGFGFLHEACVQLWGEAGQRQCHRPDGGLPEVGVAAAGGGPLASSLLLTRADRRRLPGVSFPGSGEASAAIVPTSRQDPAAAERDAQPPDGNRPPGLRRERGHEQRAVGIAPPSTRERGAVNPLERPGEACRSCKQGQ